MTLDGAVLHEGGVTFALASVPPNILTNPITADHLLDSLRRDLFPDMPILLMAREWSGKPSYYGSPDAQRALRGVHIGRVAWSRYNVI